MMSHDNDMIMLVSGKKHLISGAVKLYGRSDTHGYFAIFCGSLLSNTGTSYLREAKTRASDSRLAIGVLCTHKKQASNPFSPMEHR